MQERTPAVWREAGWLGVATRTRLGSKWSVVEGHLRDVLGDHLDALVELNDDGPGSRRAEPEGSESAQPESSMPVRGVGARLTRSLREAIGAGRFPPGTRLPSSRVLAADLGVSRGVVVAAYEQLVAEGRLVARRGSGTRVPDAAGIGVRDATVPATPERALPPGMVPNGLLRPGVPDLALFPRAVWRRAYERALATLPDSGLGYGDPAGAPLLRAELAGYLGRVRSARVSAHDLLVTTGAAQAFALFASALRRAGIDRIGVEEPGSRAVNEQLAVHGLATVPVPVDSEGLDVAALAGTDLAAVLVTPAHQFPTGVVLSPGRRAELLAWARRRDGLVLEDDYDAEFRYDREPVGCLQGLAPDRVVLVGSVSKALAPALRLGWLCAPPAWRDAFAALKAHADLGGPVLEQVAFAHLLADGGYDRHLRRARRMHRVRRDALLAALRLHLPGARVTGVAAGLHLLIELPPTVDTDELVARAYELGLAPLAAGHGLVLGYAAHSPDQLDEAVRLLASLIPDLR